MKNTRQPVVDFIKEKHADMHIPLVENHTCAAFEEYKEVTEMVLLDFLEKHFTWVASKLSGATEALGAETIELTNWLLCFRFVL